jgi:hypothetical protein
MTPDAHDRRSLARWSADDHAAHQGEADVPERRVLDGPCVQVFVFAVMDMMYGPTGRWRN